MHQFIEKVVDVEGDGHCGFCAVPGLLKMCVDDHYYVCYALLQELISDSDYYLQLVRTEKQINEVKNALTLDGMGTVPGDKWMIMPEMGFLIAQKYNYVVVLLSIKNGKSKTFFPLRGVPPERDKIMCLAHVNDNHSVSE